MAFSGSQITGYAVHGVPGMVHAFTAKPPAGVIFNSRAISRTFGFTASAGDTIEIEVIRTAGVEELKTIQNRSSLTIDFHEDT